MAIVDPPYRSPWPIEHVPDNQIENYKMDFGNGEMFWDAIVSSTINDGDFARYVIDSRLNGWSPAPIGTTAYPTDKDIYEAWRIEFEKAASKEQILAFKNVLAAARAAKSQMGYANTPEKKALDEAQAAFRDSLTDEAWEDYRVRAKHYVASFLFSDWSCEDRPARFNRGWARRWVCKRAHDFGWTPEQFGKIDHRRGYDRHDHHIERIGKKYQWLALYDLAARMSDNLAYLGGYGAFRDGAGRRYGDAREIGLRNIDPSLLVTQTHYDGWEQRPRTWWVPAEPVLRELGPAERLAWLESDQDIINDASLIDVRNPKTKQRWLCLHSFSDWRQHGIETERQELQRDTWFRLSSLVVRKEHEAKLIEGLSGKMLTDPHSLPNIEFHGDHYLGEYPWHPSLSEIDNWTREGDWQAPPVPTRATVARYLCERGNYDYSIDKSVSVKLPAPWLARALGMRLSNGKHLAYISTIGEVMFFDPSVTDEGPQAALVDRDAFLAMLEREDLSVLWVIAGEKGAYGGRDPGRGFGGRLLHTAIYTISGQGFRREFYSQREYPSEEQLRAFFGNKALPPGVITR
ncbi:MAG: hypothetical protein WBX25_21290 [Rhodomicrobium sp.]